MESFINNSPTVVKVGKNEYRIFRNFNKRDPVIQVISKILIVDDETGKQKTFQTPSPGWDFEKIIKNRRFKNEKNRCSKMV
jgi:hypothetical protein